MTRGVTLLPTVSSTIRSPMFSSQHVSNERRAWGEGVMGGDILENIGRRKGDEEEGKGERRRREVEDGKGGQRLLLACME